MAEPKLSSRKRKTPSCPTSHPLAGIFTRSKSQIYLHRNRSGRVRPDSTRLDLYTVSGKPAIVDSSSVDDLSCILIKDLCARHIFSDGCGFRAENEEEMMKLESGVFPKSCFVTGGDDEDDIEKVDSGFLSQLTHADFTNLEPSSTDVGVGTGDAKVREDGKLNANPSLVLEEPRNIEECDLSSVVGSLNEECAHTPPHEEGVNGNKKLEFISRTTDQFTDNQSNGSNQKDEGKGKSFRRKSFHSPSSRVKLFKAPGSFSYKRLLPYLTDITKDNSCAPKMGRPLKTENGLEKKQFSSSRCQEALISEPEIARGAIKSNKVYYVNDSNSKSIESIQESSMLFSSQKGVCKGRDCSQTSVLMVEEWSKPIFDRGMEEFVIKISSKDQKLKDLNPALCLSKNNFSSDNSDDMVQINNGESENSLAEDSCGPENIKTISSSLSSMKDKCDSGKNNDVCESSEDKKQYKTEGLHKFDVRNSPIGNNPQLKNSNLSKGEPNGNLSNAEQRDNYDAEVLDHDDNSNEECVQSTPPDVDIFFKPEMVENHGHTLHHFDHALRKPLSGISSRCSSCVNNKSIDSNPRQKLVLKQCSRLKLFKTPGSMSYRRMLPFLKDATKDNSCDSRKCNYLKLEKSLKANLLSPSLIAASQEMAIGNSNGNCHPVEVYTGSSSALPITMSMASSNYKEQNLSSYQHVNESPKPFYSQLASGVYFEQNISDTNMTLETAPHESKPLATPSCSLLSSGSFPRQDAKLRSHESYVNAGGECRKSVIEVSNHAKRIEPESLYQDLYPHEASFPVTVHNKGILKRTPRGCRGPCSCLNCSSFRLHAERGFEFSRNQMQDAEEIALHLIKELSHIRYMLEKSAFGADGYAAICINQVKEACRRASEAELLAQNRLGEMNFDLNIHCRVTCDQRPRVRFANYVEEKVITESDLPSQ